MIRFFLGVFFAWTLVFSVTYCFDFSNGEFFDRSRTTADFEAEKRWLNLQSSVRTEYPVLILGDSVATGLDLSNAINLAYSGATLRDVRYVATCLDGLDKQARIVIALSSQMLMSSKNLSSVSLRAKRLCSLLRGESPKVSDIAKVFLADFWAWVGGDYCPRSYQLQDFRIVYCNINRASYVRELAMDRRGKKELIFDANEVISSLVVAEKVLVLPPSVYVIDDVAQPWSQYKEIFRILDEHAEAFFRDANLDYEFYLNWSYDGVHFTNLDVYERAID